MESDFLPIANDTAVNYTYIFYFFLFEKVLIIIHIIIDAY